MPPSLFPHVLPHDRLIIALDVSSPAAALHLIDHLGEQARFYKIGLELMASGGLELIPHLKKRGKKIFLDLKLHDIPQTVEKATRRLAQLEVDFLSIHAYPQTLEAAMRGAQRETSTPGLQLLAVTVLTSWSQEDVEAAGFNLSVEQLVLRRAHQAQKAGVAGLVSSAQEVRALRAQLGANMIFVTPGIRPPGTLLGDQKRTLTPAEALQQGAHYLVIGRPITQAQEPRQALTAILEDMERVSQTVTF